jgi:hypothetical protein
MSDTERAQCSRKEYLARVKAVTLQMQKDIYTALKKEYRHMCY